MALLALSAAVDRSHTSAHRFDPACGVLLGSAFNPGMLREIIQWIASLTVLVGFLGVFGVCVTWIFRRFGYDRSTAYFSALPAGLTEMTIVGTEGRKICR